MRSWLLYFFLIFLLGSGTVRAQELPPPGGWSLRPVAELRAVPEPPGGLVPYRQGQLWGFADTTGRVWIRPVFEAEPTFFGEGLLLRRPPAPALPPRQRNSKPVFSHKRLQLKYAGYSSVWNIRYGQQYSNGEEGIWHLSPNSWQPHGPTWLLNSRGEQVMAPPNQAFIMGPDSSWRAEERPLQPNGRQELVAIQADYPFYNVKGMNLPGRVFTVPLRPLPPTIPSRLLRLRAYDLDPDFASEAGQDVTLQFLARKVNWWLPRKSVWRSGRCGLGVRASEIRYRHHEQQALFDAHGHRLTAYRYDGMKHLLPNRLAYWHSTGDEFGDEYAADSSGLVKRWQILESNNGPARRYGLLDGNGHEITLPLYVRVEVVAPNSLWVVAVVRGRLHYGLIDTLGRYHLPLSPHPISLADVAGLLRRRSSAPVVIKKNHSYWSPVQYPDTATIQYLNANGRPAFAGRFKQASEFWQGRALVRQGARYGIIDTLGKWVLPLQPDTLRYDARSSASLKQREKVDPFTLFDDFCRGNSWSYPGDSLLLTQGVQGFGLRAVRTGRLVVADMFDNPPEPWLGAVVGKHRGRPVGITYNGQLFDPEIPAGYPAGVQKPKSESYLSHLLLQHTEQGWRTRGGRPLWRQ